MLITKTSILLSLLTVYHFSTASTEPCNVSLVITDQEGEKLIGAYVEIASENLKSISDINGEVVFRLAQGQSYSIRVQSLGFETINSSIQVPFSQKYRHSLTLKKSTTELEEIVIKGQSEEERILEQPHKAEFISLSDIRAQPVDIVNIINQLPGMRIRQNGGAGSGINISLNGIGGKGVKVFVNEIPVYLLGAGYSINNIPQGIIENIEVYKGTIPVKFGSDALGGVINIKTRQQNADYLDASYSYGSWNTHQSTLAVNKRFGSNQRFNVGIEGFYTYSDNNYWMDNVDIVVDDLNNTEKGRARRFNDTFDSQMGRITLGARDLSWADQLQIFSSFSHVYNEIQHGVFAIVPWGETNSEEESWSTALSWKKFGKKDRWDLNVSVGFIANQLNFLDTARRTYFWDQNFVINTLAGESGIFSNGTTPEVLTDTYFARQNFNLALSEQHRINFTTLYTRDELLATNDAFSQEDQEDLNKPQVLTKNYSGLSLESEFLGSKLTNIASIKHFYQQSAAITLDFNGVGPLEKNTYSVFGYGNVIKYQITPALVTNLGFEYTIRQPDAEELFGDFIRIIPNPELLPEESRNVNAGLEWKLFGGKLKSGGSFFYRNTTNRIFLQNTNFGNSQYINFSTTETTGVEVNTEYQLNEQLSLGANGTYQNPILKAVDPSSGISTRSIGLRIPNEPYLFANMLANYSINKLPITQGKLKIRYSLNYVHSFLPTFKQSVNQADIPTQTVHYLSTVWLAPQDKWSLGFECRNLFDARVFDYFNVQRPGRSFYIKARLFLEKR